MRNLLLMMTLFLLISAGCNDTPSTVQRTVCPPCPIQGPLCPNSRPECERPAPLYTHNCDAGGYIVEYNDGTDPHAVTAQLSRKYGFTPKFVYDAAILGFAADFTCGTMEKLRCEPSVKLVEENEAGCLD